MKELKKKISKKKKCPLCKDKGYLVGMGSFMVCPNCERRAYFIP